jgi:cytochrome c oxidase assembly factor CtaG
MTHDLQITILKLVMLAGPALGVRTGQREMQTLAREAPATQRDVFMTAHMCRHAVLHCTHVALIVAGRPFRTLLCGLYGVVATGAGFFTMPLGSCRVPTNFLTPSHDVVQQLLSIEIWTCWAITSR